MIDPKPIFSISQFVRLLNDQLRQHHSAVRLKGEIASFTPASSGHWYLTLKDAQAQIKAVMFRPRNVLAGFRPVVGEQVEVLAQLAIYEQRGELQLIVEVMRKAGQGSLHEQYLQLKNRLAQEGLFDSDRKRRLPGMVFSLGVVTSLQAAALADVRQALKRRCPHVQYTVYHTPVQGELAASQIALALGKADAAGHDALVLCRGGGSLEDLWCFNMEEVVRAVAACHTPIVVGVGHESDVTLAELAADVRAATPTAAAELVSAPTQELLAHIDRLSQQLGRRARQQWLAWSQAVDRAELGLVTPTAYVQALGARLNGLAARLPSALVQGIKFKQQTLLHQQAIMTVAARQTIQHQQRVFDSQVLAHSVGLRRNLERLETRLSQVAGVLQAASPQRTLDRGFAFLQKQPSGEVLGRAASAKPGDAVVATLADGKLMLTVEGKARAGASSAGGGAKSG
ncbi:exodeoxyribonuclease VII large subunit [Limnobacter sp.]|uniref:exodeoxyribonuclease VII large subunit n=1 Tax=Limnobacter sp. TaxID=2003368 RepID=UPI0035124075